jgi:PKD repeat protein
MKKLIGLSSLLLIGSVLLMTSCKKPAANFTSDKTTVKVGEVVTFTDASADAEKAIFVWNFGDGATSTLKNPTHVYQKEGTYTVTETASRKKGKKPTDFVATITVVGPNPSAAITANATGTVGEVISFKSTVTNASSWAWDFGDGGMSLAPNPTHVFGVSGTYTVSLSVHNNVTDKDTSVTHDIVITGGIGDPATNAKILGKWKYVSKVVVEKVAGVVASYTGNVSPYHPAHLNNSINYTDIYHDFLADGKIIKFDANNNQTYIAGGFSVIDAGRMNFNIGVTSGVHTMTVNASTLTVVYTSTNPAYTYYNGNNTPVGPVEQVVTTTYNYSK